MKEICSHENKPEDASPTDEASLRRTEQASLGQVIDGRKIVSLPLNGRSVLSLVALTPGIAAPPRTSEGPSFPRINGGRPRVNEYLFDGISVLQHELSFVASEIGSSSRNSVRSPGLSNLDLALLK